MINQFNHPTGKCQNAMVAHLDEVTCVAFDPNGLYVLSGSELTVHLNYYLY